MRGWLYLLLACIAAGSLAYMVAIYLKVYKGITLKGLLRMLGYEDEELRETARVIRELAEYLGLRRPFRRSPSSFQGTGV